MIVLWLWDHCKNPFHEKVKRDIDYFFDAVKFRFDTEPEYKENFLTGNDLKEFPKEIDETANYITNQIGDMRNLLNIATDSIKKMEIVASRIETPKQKEIRKLNKKIGL